MRKTEVLTSNVTEELVPNGFNLMDIAIDGKEEEDGDEFFSGCFYNDVLDLRGEIKWELSLEGGKREFTVGYHHGELNVYPLIISSLR